MTSPLKITELWSGCVVSNTGSSPKGSMDSMRVVTNLLGNCVAVFAVSRWEGALDLDRAKRVLGGETAPAETETETVSVETETETVPAEEGEPAPAAKSSKEPVSEVG